MSVLSLCGLSAASSLVGEARLPHICLGSQRSVGSSASTIYSGGEATCTLIDAHILYGVVLMHNTTGLQGSPATSARRRCMRNMSRSVRRLRPCRGLSTLTQHSRALVYYPTHTHIYKAILPPFFIQPVSQLYSAMPMMHWDLQEELIINTDRCM